MRDEDRQVNNIVERLGSWLEQQPEYPLVFGADRQRRRRAARIIAYRLMTLPSVAPGEGSTNRADIRRARKRFSKMVAPGMVKVSAKQARQRAKAERDRRRYNRLSIERQRELAERAFDPEGEE